MLSIPLSSGLIGWITNVMAIQMTFYPVKFWGIKWKKLYVYVGWQGIIPAKSPKMSEKATELIKQKLLNVQEQSKNLEANSIFELISPHVSPIAQRITDELLVFYLKNFADFAPEIAKKPLSLFLEEHTPQIIANILKEATEQAHSLVDLQVIAKNALKDNPSVLNELFWKCGKEEFRFIELSGWYFGVPFGLLQMWVVAYYNPFWLLPFFGLVVGWFTNWLALQMVFFPRKPKKYLFFTFQGLFHKRQQEVAEEYAILITKKILTTERIFEVVLKEKNSQILKNIIKTEIQKTFELYESQITWFISPKDQKIMAEIAYFHIWEEMPYFCTKILDYVEQNLAIYDTIYQKMKSLPADEYENFLRPPFQEDEWILITVGAVLGALAGVLQYFILL